MTINPNLSVNELVRRYPAALPVLATAGIDTCCGGDLTLALAAAQSGLTFDQLTGRLREGISRGSSEHRAADRCGCEHKVS